MPISLFRAALTTMLCFVASAATAQISFTTQPKGVSVTTGQPATFTVAVGGTGRYTYQWRRRGFPITGATSATISLPAATQGDNDLYDVVVTGTAGTTGTATSEPARLQVAPSSYPGSLAVDLTRSFRLETADAVGLNTLITLPDGRAYLVGEISSVSGQARTSLVRLKADGTLDPSFTPPKFDQAPTRLAVQSDGKILVSGDFNAVDGAPLSHLIRLNPNGSRDTSFMPPADASWAVSEVFVGADDRIYLAGYFPTLQGAYVVKLLPSGAIDPAYTPALFTQGGIASNPAFFGFEAATGRLYVSGFFDRANGAPHAQLARLLPNGTLDPAFDPGSGANGTIYGLVPLSSGKIVLTGSFTSYSRLVAGGIVRINPDGSYDTSFATGTGFSNSAGLAVELPTGQLFVSAPGGTYNGATIPRGVRLNTNGTRDASFTYPFLANPLRVAPLPGNRLLLTGSLDASGQPSVRTLEANGAESSAPRLTVNYSGHVTLLTSAPGGKIVVAGDFTTVNGTPARHLLRLNADLTRDATLPVTAGPAGTVLSGTVQPDGKLLVFTTQGFSRLNADGTSDTSFLSNLDPNAGYFSTAPTILPDGRILITTGQSSWGNVSVNNGYVILETNGIRLLGHPYLPGPPSGSQIIGVQVLQSTGQVVVLGSFSSWNGVACNGAVRLNRDGSVDRSFTFEQNSAPTNGYRTLSFGGNPTAYQRDGRLIAVETNLISTANLIRFNGDGSRDKTFAPVGVLATPAMTMLQADDKILHFGGKGRPSPEGGFTPVQVRFDATGARDPSFSIYGSRIWQCAWIADNGELLSSDDTGYLHRYSVIPAPVIIAQPVAQAGEVGTNLTLSVTVTSPMPLTYQWLKNGIEVAGATNASLVLDHLQIPDTGSYTVVINAAGRTVTSQPAVLTVTPRAPGGTYLGQLGNGAGTFALMLRKDGTGVFLGYLTGSKTALLSKAVSLDTNRRLRAVVSASPTSPLGEIAIDATLASDGTLSGNLTPLNLSFFVLPPPNAPSTGPAGFYEAAAPGTASTVAAIVSASGDVFVVIQAAATDRGQGRIDAEGNINLTTADGSYLITGSVKTGVALWSPTAITRTTGVATAFKGANNDARTDTEKLINISTRCQVAPGGGSFTAGFVITGTQPKPVLVRGVGPTLGTFQVAGALPAVRLEVFHESTSIAVGNDWGAERDPLLISGAALRTGAFPLPAGSHDAALLLTLEPGAYSVVVSGQGGASGIALAEVYDATVGTISRSQRIVNISTRAQAGSGDAVLAAGFVVSGAVPKRLLIRGAGPALLRFGIVDALARPQIAVSSGNAILASNAGWSTVPDPAALAAAARQVGAFDFQGGSTDAALVIYLAPGDYSAQLTGVNGATGVGLVEVYELP